MSGRQQISKSTDELFRRLRSDMLNLHMRWKFFRQLYADETGERLALLSQTAADFFHIVQWLFLHDTCLSLSRITDPARTCGRENLVLEQLAISVESDVPSNPICTALRLALENACEATKPFRKLRNRTIAHCDLESALHPEKNSLPGISRLSVDTALNAVVDFLDVFEAWYLESQTQYRSPITYQDGRFLLRALEQARRYRQLEKEAKVPVVEIPGLHIGA